MVSPEQQAEVEELEVFLREDEDFDESELSCDASPAEQIVCPVCGAEFEEVCDFVTYWGEAGDVITTCESCDAKLRVAEHVERTWTVTVEAPK